jgi:3-oxoacyl-[acyl-carrier-protein] synthase-1
MPAPSLGETTAETVRAVSANIQAGDAMFLFADLNGEEYRAAEFGTALMRLKRHMDVDSWRLRVTAAEFGDTGAAAPALGLGLATRALTREHQAVRHAMILTYSDYGEASAFTIERNS